MISLAALAILCAVGVDALTADNIVVNAHDFLYSQTTTASMTVDLSTVKDGRSGSRDRQFSVLRLNLPEDESRFYVYFHEPFDVKGTVLVTWNHGDSSRDRWLYLPALDRVNRLSTKDERTSFVGSVFFYEDLTGRPPEQDHHQRLTDQETDDFYVVKSTPKQPAEVEFEWYETWVTKQGFVPVQIRYYRGGEVYREIRVTKVEEIDRIQTAVVLVAREGGTESTLTYSAIDYDVALTEEMFSERYFKTPPSIVKER